MDVLLTERGQKLRADLLEQRKFGPADMVLVDEACRIADRLDRLDMILAGDMDEWTSLEFRAGQVTKLVVDDVLGEARQQANALRQIFSTLKLAGVEVADDAVDRADDLMGKRLARQSRASAS